MSLPGSKEGELQKLSSHTKIESQKSRKNSNASFNVKKGLAGSLIQDGTAEDFITH